MKRIIFLCSFVLATDVYAQSSTLEALEQEINEALGYFNSNGDRLEYYIQGNISEALEDDFDGDGEKEIFLPMVADTGYRATTRSLFFIVETVEGKHAIAGQEYLPGPVGDDLHFVDGRIVFSVTSYQEGDPGCCPSKTTMFKIRYENGEIK